MLLQVVLVNLLSATALGLGVRHSNATRSQRSYLHYPGSVYGTVSTSYLPSFPSAKVYINDKYGKTIVKSATDYYQETHICEEQVCGTNAYCAVEDDHAVCCCIKGYFGDPLTHCERPECLDDSECSGHQTCEGGTCVNLCPGLCGIEALCDARNHVPVCSCPPGYTGDPYALCRKPTPEELCNPSPCGPNTLCEASGNIAVCKCAPGYFGQPVTGCSHECESNYECPDHLACVDFKCADPCTCGHNAECVGVRSHVPICKCFRGYYGNPLLACRPECEHDSDCPSFKPSCSNNKCTNPCEGACASGAHCQLSGVVPVCSCPEGYVGNPYELCQPEVVDYCLQSNPCGVNAICETTANHRAECSCPPNYVGDPLVHCYVGECLENSDCPDHKACINHYCQNPCFGKCAPNANCITRKHLAICSCPPSYNGDALIKCYYSTPSFVSRRYIGK